MGTDLKRGDWTEDRCDLATRMYKAGSSASEIRIKLNEQPGFRPVTRNAVIGRLLRMGLTRADKQQPAKRARRVSPYAPAARPRAAQPLSRAAIAASSPDQADALEDELAAGERELALAAPLIGAITVLDLNDSRCRWPRDVPSGVFSWTFCGARPEAGTPYCSFHARIAYQAPQPRRDQRPRPR